MSFFWNTLGGRYDDVQSKKPVTRPSRPVIKPPVQEQTQTFERNMQHLTAETVIEPIITFEQVPVVVDNPSPVSVDALSTFDKYDFDRNNASINSGVYSCTHVPSPDREVVSNETGRVNDDVRSQLFSLQQKYTDFLSEMANLHERMTNVTNQFSVLSKDV